jgi:hypothetical protein
MSKLILLLVGAAWLAVLLPPLLRARFDVGSSSSVSDFRRQLNSLQRTQAPRTQVPMRAMSRPLVSAPRVQPVRRPAPAPYMNNGHDPYEYDAATPLHGGDGTGRHRRAHHQDLTRSHYAREEVFLSPREVVRRRRANVLYGLLALNAITLFLSLTTGSTALIALFAVAVIALMVYCYMLVQLRQQEYLRRVSYYRRAA